MVPGPSMARKAPVISLNGSAPHCEHMAGQVPVAPQADHCPDCLARGERWVALVVCLRCGWVACSDDSPNRHAQAHYQETDHPIARGLEPGSQWRWCYVHGRLV
jgi:uncharacterized UBP type Zn finger protein